MIYDVIIIGVGVIGTFAARVLSQYNLKVCITEKESDVSMGSSKANSGIVHAGYDAVPGSLKARFNVAGNKMMENVCSELDVPFKRTGSLVLAFGGDNMDRLKALYERGLKNGADGLALINSTQLHDLEPNVSEAATAALLAPSAGIVCPYELTLGAVENAVENGVELRTGCKVDAIKYEEGLFTLAVSGSGVNNGSRVGIGVNSSCRGNRGADESCVGSMDGLGIGQQGKAVVEKLQCRFVVNAAGMFADKISAMIGDDSFLQHPRKGEYILYDKSMGETVHHVIFQLPDERGKGILVTQTVDGNLLIGPNAHDIDDRCDAATSAAGLQEVLNGARKSVPSLQLRDVITSFAGLRSKCTGGDFILRPSEKNDKFIMAAGIDSPGITAAPAIGLYIAELLEKQGLKLEKKAGYNPERKNVVRFRELSDEEIAALAAKEPAYGRVVCRCEKVTEGEVIDCIRRPAGARSVDAVKRRTRSGMGRCQGGFCSPRIMEILSRELNIPLEEVTKNGGESKLLAGRVK